MNNEKRVIPEGHGLRFWIAAAFLLEAIGFAIGITFGWFIWGRP